MEFFDKSGHAIAYLDNDGETIYLWNGRPVAYLAGESVYAIKGKHLGYINGGWIRDRHGRPVVFTEDSDGNGPMKPMIKMKPMRAMQKMQPMRGMPQMPPMPAVPKLSWSPIPADEFFTQ